MTATADARFPRQHSPHYGHCDLCSEDIVHTPGNRQEIVQVIVGRKNSKGLSQCNRQCVVPTDSCTSLLLYMKMFLRLVEFLGSPYKAKRQNLMWMFICDPMPVPEEPEKFSFSNVTLEI